MTKISPRRTRSEKLVFPGQNGSELAGRLDLPAGDVRAWAIFAHCFTCGKDIAAAARVARGLAARGFGVLRFDFTGLGGSAGDFANTNFTSNVDDLVAAARYLAEHHGAPRLLVGHSLGGAAVLVAARRIDSIEAVATINAPAEPKHVAQHLDVRAIEANGEAEVHLGGRPFTIRRQFLEDLEEHNLGGELGALDKALLVMHSPLDRTVSIENAERIYKAARGYRSFVTLGDADHLLSRAEDAEYAADVLSAWATRYVTFEPVARAEPDEGNVLVEELGPKYTNRVAARDHELTADEPRKIGGLDAGPTPYEYLMAGLGACTSITLRMYADRKGWPLERVAVHVDHGTFDEPGGGIRGRDRFTRAIELFGDLTDDQRARLMEIAERCPVHRTLERSSVVETRERRG